VYNEMVKLIVIKEIWWPYCGHQLI